MNELRPNGGMRFFCAVLACLLLVVHAGAEEFSLQPYQTKSKQWTYVSFGRAPSAADGAEAPILWRVLAASTERALLLSDRLLFAARIDGQESGYAGWETSELYGRLNGEFMRASFSYGEQAALLPQEDGALVSLPAVEDLRNPDYGFADDRSRRASGTDYARANGLQVYPGSRKDSPYWTRTPSEHAGAHRRVMNEGKWGYRGVADDTYGVRPMVLVSLAEALPLTGSGTQEDPFVLAFEEPEMPPEDGTEEPAPADPDETPEDQPPEAQDDLPGDEVLPGPSAAASSVTEYAALFPALTEEGYLPEGAEEFSYADPDKGLWLYVSTDMRVEIVRKTDTAKKSEPRRWFEAEIFVREGSGEFLKTYYHELNPRTKKLAETQVIARENHLVFAINTDWYYYRVLRNAKKRTMPVGVILRGGEVFYDDPTKNLSNIIPTRDYLALYPDGNMEAFDYNGPGGEELLALGAYETLCFGPILLRDGEMTEPTKRLGAKGNNNPRTAVGMVTPGHYVAIMVEGRTKKSVGCRLDYLADLFAKKGCRVAFNLDGGGTSSMIFMGVYLNENTYGAQNRLQNEVLGIGVSENVN